MEIEREREIVERNEVVDCSNCNNDTQNDTNTRNRLVVVVTTDKEWVSEWVSEWQREKTKEHNHSKHIKNAFVVIYETFTHTYRTTRRDETRRDETRRDETIRNIPTSKTQHTTPNQTYHTIVDMVDLEHPLPMAIPKWVPQEVVYEALWDEEGFGLDKMSTLVRWFVVVKSGRSLLLSFYRQPLGTSSSLSSSSVR